MEMSLSVGQISLEAVDKPQRQVAFLEGHQIPHRAIKDRHLSLEGVQLKHQLQGEASLVKVTLVGNKRKALGCLETLKINNKQVS